MRQLITRIDEDLHGRLRDRARAEGRSVASLVREVLRSAVQQEDGAAIRSRVGRSGLVTRPDAPSHVPPLDELLGRTRGSGTAVSAALEAERGVR